MKTHIAGRPYTPATGTVEDSLSFITLNEEAMTYAALIVMSSETGRDAYQIRIMDIKNDTLEAMGYTKKERVLARWANLLVENGTDPADAFSALIEIMGDKPRRVLIDGAGRFIVI